MPEPRWRALPPLRVTDSITALAAHNGFVLAGNAAGLFRRQEPGGWRRLDVPATDVQAIAFAEGGGVLAVGAGSAVDVSADGGRSWRRAELETSGRVTALGISGASILAGTDRDGAFLSANEGKSWAHLGLEGQMVLAVHGDKLAGTEQGLWRRESGSKWRKLPLDAVVTAVCATGDGLLAGTEDHGVFRSIDGGASWQKCSGVEEGINALAASGARALAGTSTGRVYESPDAGLTWSPLEALPTAIMALALDAEGAFAGTYRAGLFELEGKKWRPVNEGLESAGALDLLWTRHGLLAVALDGLRRFDGASWQELDPGVPGDPRAAAAALDGQLLLATTAGVFAGGQKVGDWPDVSIVRAAPNGDLAALTEPALHLRLDGKWTEFPRSEREKTIDVAFSPGYPNDEGLLLVTVRQGTRTSVVRCRPKAQEVDRLFDYDARSPWLSIALPPDMRVNPNRPANFYAGTGGSLFRPAWPGDHWERDVLHDPNAIVLSLALSPNYLTDKTVAVGTSAGAVLTRNAGLLWVGMDDGLEDRRCLKLTYAPDGRLFCLTPTRVYQLEEGREETNVRH
jgi:hypothetical protein